MAMTKGTDLVSLSKELRERGPAVEQAFKARLSPEELATFEQSLATRWTPIEKQMAVYQAAALHLFPQKPMPMKEIGRLVARRTYGGIYRIFLRIPKVTYIVGKAAQMWSTFYDVGEASVENFIGKKAEFVIRDFPNWPKPMREMAIGHIEVLLESTGAKRVVVTLDESNPLAWRYNLTWE